MSGGIKNFHDDDDDNDDDHNYACEWLRDESHFDLMIIAYWRSRLNPRTNGFY